MRAYLDIETSFEETVTVVGVFVPGRGVTQLVAPRIDSDAVQDALRGCDSVCTFNGDRFDMPEIRRAFAIEMLADFLSVDLHPECARRGLRGGLKSIEESLGIQREVKGVTGYDAMVLWRRWEGGDRSALDLLLAYNREDVVNLVALERRLAGDLSPIISPV